MKNLIFIQDENHDIKVYSCKFMLIGYIKFNEKLNLWTWENIPQRYLTLCRLNEIGGYMKRLSKKKKRGIQKNGN